MNAAKNNVVYLDGHGGNESDELARVSPGEYLACYSRHAGTVVFGSPKLRLDMRLVEHPDIVLSRWYRVQDSRGGRIRASRHSDLVRELSAVLGMRVRADRVPVTQLKGLVVRIDVQTIMTDYRQQRLADVNQYSGIARLIERVQP